MVLLGNVETGRVRLSSFN